MVDDVVFGIGKRLRAGNAENVEPALTRHLAKLGPR